MEENYANSSFPMTLMRNIDPADIISCGETSQDNEHYGYDQAQQIGVPASATWK